MATLLKADGTSEEVMAGKGQFSLKEMYELIGCELVEVVYLADGKTMWIDEEGKFKQHELNHLATNHLHRAGGSHTDYVAGNALICKDGEVS